MPAKGSVTRRAPDGTWAAALCRARESAGITRSEMARRLGVTRPNITMWEGGSVGVTEALVHRYADALGMKAELVLVPS